MHTALDLTAGLLELNKKDVGFNHDRPAPGIIINNIRTHREYLCRKVSQPELSTSSRLASYEDGWHETVQGHNPPAR